MIIGDQNIDCEVPPQKFFRLQGYPVRYVEIMDDTVAGQMPDIQGIRPIDPIKCVGDVSGLQLYVVNGVLLINDIFENAEVIFQEEQFTLEHA